MMLIYKYQVRVVYMRKHRDCKRVKRYTSVRISTIYLNSSFIASNITQQARYIETTLDERQSIKESHML